jgi:hypothetical protein
MSETPNQSPLSDRASKALADMFKTLDKVNVDEIKTDGITIRAGKRLVKLQVVLDQEVSIDDEVREEYRLKLREKLQEIKDRINQKISEVVEMANRVRMESERKENDLREQLRRSTPMPEITLDHAKKGLSVVKGRERGEYIWLVQGMYAPKTVDRKPLDPRYAKKLMTQIVFVIRTKENKIIEVSSRYPNNLEYFQHYHQARPDCWGTWKYPAEWKSLDDLIRIARSAEAVMENINTMSIANSTPHGLPRRTSLDKHVRNVRGAEAADTINAAGEPQPRQAGAEDIWSIS